MKLFQLILNAVYPTKCAICNKINSENICFNCKYKIKKIMSLKIKKIKNKYFSEHIYLFKYDNIIRKLIILYKFNDKGYLYKFFSNIILNNPKLCYYIKSYDIIVPVPMHKKKIKIRGYNQAELIARELEKNLKSIEFNKNLLVKIRNTKVQSSLNKLQRQKNLSNAYITLNKDKIKDKKILLIDDVYTTGSTANECSKVLMQAGASKIGILTIAKD